MIKIETIGMYISNIHVYIRPFNNIKDVLGMFPCSYNRAFSANFAIKTGTHNSVMRWGGIMNELMKVAKFHKTLIYNPSIFSDYKIIIENKLLMGSMKYEILLDTNFHENGYIGKITIKTGQPSSEWGATYLACEKEIINLVRQMYFDIGFAETDKLCKKYSYFADVESY
jgi:hypothetical protein